MRNNVFVLPLLMAFAAISHASDLTSKRVDFIELQEVSASNLFEQLLSKKIRIRMGIEQDSSSVPSGEISPATAPLALHDATVSEILDAFCKRTHSEWHEDSGVINIYPLGLSQRKGYFLNLRADVSASAQDRELILLEMFRNLSSEDPTIVVTTNGDNIDVQRGQSKLQFLGHRTSGEPGLSGSGPHGAKIDHSLQKLNITLRGKTLRELLNELVRQDHRTPGAGIWIATSDGNNISLNLP